MLTVRRDSEIHQENGGWFQARWHFSFDRYYDPQQMGVGALRVFNDDRIVAGAEWPMHPHRDIESLTYVVEGHFEHADSLLHSERNASQVKPLRFIQFWILPSKISRDSTVQQHQYTAEDRANRWLQIMSPPGEAGLDLRQDARVWVSRLTAGEQLSRTFDRYRGGYAYVIDGDMTLGGQKVSAGDAAKLEGPEDLTVEAAADTDLIVVDVPLRYASVGVWARR